MEESKEEIQSKVLIVDDIERYRNQAKEQLSKNYEVKILSTPEAAIKLLREGKKPDFAIFDCFMPIKSKKMGKKIVDGIKKSTGRGAFVEEVWVEKRLAPAGLVLALIFRINGVPSNVLRGVAHNNQTEKDEITAFSKKVGITDLPHKYYDEKRDVKLWREELENLQKEVNNISQNKAEFYKTILKQEFDIDVDNFEDWLKG